MLVTSHHPISACAGAIGCTVGAIYVPQREIKLGPITTDTFFALICLALALWGVAQGAGSSALEALLADSVPTGVCCSCCTEAAQIPEVIRTRQALRACSASSGWAMFGE